MPSTALLIDHTDTIQESVALISPGLSCYAIKLESITASAISDAPIEKWLNPASPPLLVLFGRGIENPLPLARQIYAFSPAISLVFLVESSDGDLYQQLKSPIARIGSQWNMVNIHSSAFSSELTPIIEATLRKTQFSTTLRNINSRLAARMATGVSDIRRHSVSDRFYSSIMEHAQDAIIGTNKNGTIISWNRAAEEMFDLDHDHAIGESIISICGGDWYPNLNDVFSAKTLVNSDYRRLEFTAVRSDGKKLFLEMAVSSVKDTDEEMLGYSVILRNIAERKMAEQALLESEARYRTVVETASDGVITIDSNSIIQYFNPAAERIFGYQSTQIIGKSVTDLMPKSLRNRHSGSMKNYLESGKKNIPWSGVEVTGLRRNGEEFPVEISFGEYQSKGEHLFTGIVRDITERKQLEHILRQSNIELEQRVLDRTRDLSKANEILEQSNIELRRYAYVASHDLKSPLRSISGFAQLLQDKYKGQLDELADHWIERVVENANKMQSLIENILNYSKVNSNISAFEIIDFNEAVQEVLSSIANVIEERKAKIVFDDLPKIIGVRSQIIQLIQNLIENGLKYNKSEIPEISISAVNKDHEWEFRVTDNGIGIDKKHFESIFTTFSRLHAYHEYPGTGIGLSVCRRIVHQHGGHIWVDSEPDKGSSFYFTLPVKPDKR